MTNLVLDNKLTPAMQIESVKLIVFWPQILKRKRKGYIPLINSPMKKRKMKKKKKNIWTEKQYS